MLLVLLPLLAVFRPNVATDLEEVGTNFTAIADAVADAVGHDDYNLGQFAQALKKFGSNHKNLREDGAIGYKQSLHETLGRIDPKLQSISNSVRFEDSSIEYRTNRDKIQTVHRRFMAYLAEPEERTEMALMQACVDYNPGKILAWIHAKVLSPVTGPSLFSGSTIDDNRKFSAWAKIVGVGALLASQLQVICIDISSGASEENASIQLSEISDAILRHQMDLQTNFVARAELDVKDWAATRFRSLTKEIADAYYTCILTYGVAYELLPKNCTSKAKNLDGINGLLRDSIQENLSAKYNWLQWSVHVYNGVPNGWSEHTASGFRPPGQRWGYHLMKTAGKNIAINWSHKDDWAATKEKLKQAERIYWSDCVSCHTEDLFRRPYVSPRTCLEECLASVRYSLLLVVRDGNEIRSTGINKYSHNRCGQGQCVSVVIGV